MRIGINALQLSGRNSGIGQYIYNMTSSLLSIGREQFILYLSRGNVRKEWLGKKNLELKEIPFSKEQVILRNLYELINFGLDLRRDRLSLFWSPDTKIPLIIPSAIPFVVTVHDLAIFKKPQSYKLSRVLYWRELFTLAIKKATFVVAISKTTRNDLIEVMKISPSKIKVIYNGVNPLFKPISDNAYLARIQKKYSLPEKFLLFVGLFSPRKNIAGIFRAFAIMKDMYKIPHALVMVGGNGWKYRTDLELVKLLGLKDEIYFPGFVEDNDLPAVYNLADVFIFPSFYEGFGLPILEAMACGTPVVTSNVSALPEIAGKAAVLVNPHDPEEIAFKVYQILENNLFVSNLIKIGLERSQQFSWYNAAKELIKVFQEIT